VVAATPAVRSVTLPYVTIPFQSLSLFDTPHSVLAQPQVPLVLLALAPVVVVLQVVVALAVLSVVASPLSTAPLPATSAVVQITSPVIVRLRP